MARTGRSAPPFNPHRAGQWDRKRKRKEKGEIDTFPKGQVDTANIFGNVNFTTPFVARANEHGIVLNYFTSFGRYRGSFIPERNAIAEVRRRQYALTEEEALGIAGEIVCAKIRTCLDLWAGRV